jgi:MFS family permease
VSRVVRELTPIAFAVVALAFIFNFLGRGVADAYSAFVLPLEREFGWARRETAGVFSTYMLLSGLAAPLAGLLFDRYGPRLVYCCGLALLGAGAYLAGEATQLWQLYTTAGVMIGTGVGALGMVCAASLIGRWFRRNLATAIAVAYAGFGCGILVTLPLVQYLIEILGWREAYQRVGIFVLLLVPICLVLPWRRLAAGRPEPSRRDNDTIGQEVVGWTLAQAIRTPSFWRLAQVFFFTAVAIYSVTPQTIAFFIEMGFTPLLAASVFGAAGLLSTLGIVGTGWLADHVGFTRAAIMSFTLTGCGIVSLFAISFAPVTGLLLVYVLFFGLAQGARGPIVSTLSTRFFSGGATATIYGAIYFSMTFGAAVGSFLGGILHDLAGYRPVFVFSLTAILLAAEAFRPGALLDRAATVVDAANRERFKQGE